MRWRGVPNQKRVEAVDLCGLLPYDKAMALAGVCRSRQTHYMPVGRNSMQRTTDDGARTDFRITQ
jgi:hypothetical protein